MADLSAQVEAFLRNALRQKKLEDRLVGQALRDLRRTLVAIERVVGQAGVLSVGPQREQAIQRVTAAVAKSVQDSFGVPQLAALQEALAPFIDKQMAFARQMVEMAGGDLAAPVAITPMQAAQMVNQAVVAGKTLQSQLAASVPALVADRIERYIRLGLSDAGGETVATYQDAVVRVTERNVEALIRTGVHEVGSAAQALIYEFETDPDWLGSDGLVWTAVLDSRACPVCIGLDGRRYQIGTPAAYFDGRNKVSPHPQCVLGDTEIDGGILAAGMRTTYAGPVVTIRTHAGRVLSVTENHPVLTSNGWKPAKFIDEGDQLVCRAVAVEPAIHPDLNQRPATAEQLFSLLSEQATVRWGAVPAAPVDFHGDGAGMHGDVDVACVNRELLFNDQAVCAEHLSDPLLIAADVQLSLVVEPSPLDQLLLAAHATASGFVGSRDLVAALLFGHGGPLESLGLALGARRDPRFDQPVANGATADTKSLCNLVLTQARAVQMDDGGDVRVGLGADGHALAVEAVSDRLDAAAMDISQLVHALPGLIALDDVVGVEIESRHGVPVYDFSTLSGAYFASGILTHNCRCYLVPWKWRNEDMQGPSGPEPTRREAKGDNGAEALSFRKAAKQWVKDNPETAQAIFGKKLGQDLVDGKVSFDQAIKLWRQPKA